VRREDLPKVLEVLEREFPKWKAPVGLMAETHGGEPFKVLLCALLSTRTKDETTFKVCRRLFEKVKSPEDLASAKVEEIEELIYPVGFYRVKARQLKELSRLLVEKFGGKVPDRLEELLKLPGVGRKVANLVLSKAFGKPAVAVDVHVHRITNRWRLLKTKSPEETERELEKLLPDELKGKFNYLLVALGQTFCLPRSPKCGECPIREFCGRCL